MKQEKISQAKECLANGCFDEFISITASFSQSKRLQLAKKYISQLEGLLSLEESNELLFLQPSQFTAKFIILNLSHLNKLFSMKLLAKHVLLFFDDNIDIVVSEFQKTPTLYSNLMENFVDNKNIIQLGPNSAIFLFKVLSVACFEQNIDIPFGIFAGFREEVSDYVFKLLQDEEKLTGFNFTIPIVTILLIFIIKNGACEMKELNISRLDQKIEILKNNAVLQLWNVVKDLFTEKCYSPEKIEILDEMLNFNIYSCILFADSQYECALAEIAINNNLVFAERFLNLKEFPDTFKISNLLNLEIWLEAFKVNIGLLELQNIVKSILQSVVFVKISTLTENERLIVLSNGDLINIEKLPKEPQLNKNMNLKEEEDCKKQIASINEERLELLEEEKVFRDSIMENSKNILKIIEFLLKSTTIKNNHEVALSLFEILITIGPYCKDSVESLLSALSEMIVVKVNNSYISAALASPNFLLLLLNFLKIELPSDKYESFLREEISNDINSKIRFSRDFYHENDMDKLFEHESKFWIEANIVFPITFLLPVFETSHFNEDNEKLFLILLEKELKEEKISFDLEEILSVIFSFHFSGEIHQEVIEAIFEKVSFNNIDVTEKSLKPILNCLLNSNVSIRDLSVHALSKIPEKKEIIYDPLLETYLFLAEEFSDSITRFFIASGGRSSFISKPAELSVYLCNLCFDENNGNLLEYLPHALKLLCEEISNQSFLESLISSLLDKHLSYEGFLEDTLFDVSNHRASCRKVIWECISELSEFIESFDSSMEEEIKQGFMMFPVSRIVPVSLGFDVLDSERLVDQRNSLLNVHICEGKFKIVEASSEKTTYLKFLEKSEYALLETNPSSIKLSLLLLERFLMYGLFDFDDYVVASAMKAITAIINSYGNDYLERSEYAFETNRLDLLQNISINSVMDQIAVRLIKFSNNVLDFGVVHEYTIEASQIKHLNLNALSKVLDLLSSISSFLSWKDETRGKIINFIESIVEIQDSRIDAILYESIFNSWSSIIKVNNKEEFKTKNCVFEHEKYDDSEEFAVKYLIPRYLDTLEKKYEDFPGSGVCLAGVVASLGLNWMNNKLNFFNIVIECFENDDIEYKLIGISILKCLLKKFMYKMEPYVKIYFKYLLLASVSDNLDLEEESISCLLEELKSLSQFGIEFLVPTIVDYIESDDWELVKGSCDFVHQIASNSAKLNIYSHREILAKFLPIILPYLQEHLYNLNSEVEESATSAIEKIAESVETPVIRGISSRIIEAYNKPELNRNILLDISEMTFEEELDSGSLNLLLPICEKVLCEDSSIIYHNNYDHMAGIHTKVIAANCLILFSEISNYQCFALFLPKIEQLLVNNLAEPNADIRKACSNALSVILFQNSNLLLRTESELKNKLVLENHHIIESNGLSEAIVYISVKNNSWPELLNDIAEMLSYYQTQDLFTMEKCSCGEIIKIYFEKEVECECCNLIYEKNQPLKQEKFATDQIAIVLYLLYLPQCLVESNDDTTLEEFTKYYLDFSLDLMFKVLSVPELVEDVGLPEIHNIGRELVTSFLNEKNICITVGQSIIYHILSDSEQVRLFSISIIGDLISELGSTSLDASNEKALKDEIKNMRDEYIEVTLQPGNEQKQSKVFIPEPAIQSAIRMLSEDIYDNLMLNLLILRFDEIEAVKIAAVNIWKLVTLKPTSTIENFLHLVPNYFSSILERASLGFFKEFEAKAVIMRVVRELVFCLSEEEFEPLMKFLVQSLNDYSDDESKLLPILLMLTAVAEADKTGELIDISVLVKIPTIVKNCKSIEVSSAASDVLNNIQVDVSDIVNSIIEPLILELEKSESFENTENLAESLYAVIGNKFTLIKQLINQLFSGQTPITFVIADFFIVFIQLSECLQENISLLFEECFSLLLRDCSKIIASCNEYNNENFDIDLVHPIIKIMDHISKIEYCDDEMKHEVIEEFLGYVRRNLLDEEIIVSAPSIICASSFISNHPIYFASDKSIFVALIHTVFNELIFADFKGCFVFFVKCIKVMYEKLSNTDLFVDFVKVLSEEFSEAILSNAEAKVMPSLCSESESVHDFIILIADITCDSRTDEQTRETLIFSTHLLILAVYNSFCIINSQVNSNMLEIEQFRFKVPQDVTACPEFDCLSTSYAGKLLQVQSNIFDEIRYSILNFINIETSFCAKLNFYDIIIRNEIEKKCLFSEDKKLEELGYELFVNMCKINLRKEEPVMELVNLLFESQQGEVIGIHSKIGEKSLIFCLELLDSCLMCTNFQTNIKVIAKPKEIKPKYENLYQSIICLIIENFIYTDKIEFKNIAAQVIATCFYKLFITDQVLCIKLVQEYLLVMDNPENLESEILIWQKIFLLSLNYQLFFNDLNKEIEFSDFLEFVMDQKQLELFAELSNLLLLRIIHIENLNEQVTLQESLHMFETIIESHLLKNFGALSEDSLEQFLDGLMIFEKYSGNFVPPFTTQTFVGIFSVELHQKCLVSESIGVGQLAQQALIQFYRLRFGKDVWASVQNIVKLNNSLLCDDLEHRISTIQKLIKEGKI